MPCTPRWWRASCPTPACTKSSASTSLRREWRTRWSPEATRSLAQQIVEELAQDGVRDRSGDGVDAPFMRQDHGRGLADVGLIAKLDILLHLGRNRLVVKERPRLFHLLRVENAGDHGIDFAAHRPADLLPEQLGADQLVLAGI